MLRHLTTAACLFFLGAGSLNAQTADVAMAGVQICDCLPADNYLLVKKKKTVEGVASTVFHANVEVLITFLTAYREPGVRAAIEREGYHCIEKPYDSRELVGHIRDALTPGAEAS